MNLGCELRRVTHGWQAPKADINVELSHITRSHSRFVERLSEEFDKALELFSRLHLERFDYRVSTSMLVDDKVLGIPKQERNEWFNQISRELPEVFERLNYVAFESDLKSYVSTMYTKIVPSQARTVQRSIERWIRTKGQTACSHDIAVWHLMRNGVFGPKNLPVHRVVCQNNESDLPVSFCAPRVMSILNIEDKEPEELADAEILRFIDPELFDWRLVHRCYYFASYENEKNSHY